MTVIALFVGGMLLGGACVLAGMYQARRATERREAIYRHYGRLK